MNKLLFIVAFLLFSSINQSARAEKLGVCYRCISSFGIESHMWSRGYLGLAGFCESMGSNSSGRGLPHMCDAQTGILQYAPTNDRFTQCVTNASDHEAWIGGENDDLLILTTKSRNINAGSFYRLENGRNFKCGYDVVSGSNFTALRHGQNRDIISLFRNDGSGKFAGTTYTRQDGRGHAIIAGSNYVAILYGQNKDIVELFGITANGRVIRKVNLINDGVEHKIEPLGKTDFGITYGRNDDIRLRLCFTGARWMSGYIGIGQPFKATCDTNVTW